MTETIRYKNGEYEGDVVNGNPHGKGKVTYDFGSHGKTVYEGDWVNGEYHGKGKLTYNNGTILEGDFVNGKLHGKGKLIEAGHKNTYEGDFVNGKEHGYGKHTSDEGVFEGEYIKGRRHKGKCTYNDGRVEDGYWKYYKFYGNEVPPEDKPLEPISEEHAHFLSLR